MAVVAMVLSSCLWALEEVAAAALAVASAAALAAVALAAEEEVLAGKLLNMNILTKKIIKQ
jgi:hypothetical protein